MRRTQTSNRERGAILLVVVFLATAIAAIAAISSGRVVAATKNQRVMEQETRAFNSAYAQIHMAMNVVNNSAYNQQNQNLEMRAAIAGNYGGTVKYAGETEIVVEADYTYFYDENGNLIPAGGEDTGYTQTVTVTTSESMINPEFAKWLDDAADPLYGLIRNTNVRVYRARDYVKRLQRLKGETITDVDPGGLSDSYYILEAAGRAGRTVRLVSALVRENEPFSSFVFFQNRATLGVSGAPRGLIHSNEDIEFYFAGGKYVDSVSAVSSSSASRVSVSVTAVAIL